ncbi:MAG TPA: hypothetical protein VM575_19540 [Nocardioides sp.]|nr:hypothetical protein [Nocardioides sp.]
MIGHDTEESTIDIEELEDKPPERPEEGLGRADSSWRSVELGLAVLAAIVLAVGLVTWNRAGDHDAASVQRAELRDAVLITARSHIETLQTLDYRDVDGGLAKWEDVATGTLKDQLLATTDETRQLLADQQKVTAGKVVDAAIVDLTDDTATVIAAVETTVADGADAAAEPTVKRDRFTADLTKVGDDWLLESLVQVAVNLS